MKAVIQRVSEASVTVDARRTAAIGPGLLVLLCVERGDASARLISLHARSPVCEFSRTMPAR
jgi:D-aminoacyl-tRNA deacylase